MARSCIAHEEAMSLFPHWMAAVAQAFNLWISSMVARDITTFREWSGVVSAQSWALVRGTNVRSPGGQSDPWLQVYANHLAVGNVMGWPRDVLPVLQQPLYLCAVSQSWQWLSYLTSVRCGCMTGSCDEPY